MRRIPHIAVLTATVLALAGTGSAAAAGVCGTAATPPSGYDHVVWIVMENKAVSQIIGSANAPYVNQLASQCGSASQFFAVAHPSLPNYIAMTSGSTQGITDDSGPSSHRLGVASIFSQVGALFLTWDEDDRSSSNHIATVVMAPSVRPGTVSSTHFTHYSMLGTTEQLLGLGLLGNAASAASMRSAFHL